MAKFLMLQGTSSHVGKSILTTAFCRIFLRDGFRVAPFKAQNMALNSYVTPDGGEMGRAQVAQAEAAGLTPSVEMNPVLLKPTGNSRSQVILLGRPIGNMSAAEYHSGYSLQAWSVVRESLASLSQLYEVVVIEGAGSPAEVNLKAHDIVNMKVAKQVNAPILLVADIDRGGAIASVVGTLMLLDESERDLIKGIVINKFRGDIKLLEPALEIIREKTGKPVVGVIPYLDAIGVDDEDSVSLDEKTAAIGRDIEIAVLRLPKISNFTDFDSLSREPDVSLRYVRKGEKIGSPDLIILPGSKNTTEDLMYLWDHGYAKDIIALSANGVPVIGICGGYQMLGLKVLDPLHTESMLEEVAGLGLLDATTVFSADKITHQVKAKCENHAFLGMNTCHDELSGYEIHMGRTEFGSPMLSAFSMLSRSGEIVKCAEGAIRSDGLVMGTYLHGLFDNDCYRRELINALRRRKGLKALAQVTDAAYSKELAYDRLADAVRGAVDMQYIYSIVGLEK